MLPRAITLVLVVLACLAVAGDDHVSRVAILHPPGFLSDRSLLRLTVRVEPDPANRLLIVAVVDPACEPPCVVRSTREDLQGADAPRTRIVEWRSVPSGEGMAVVALLYGSGEKLLAKAQAPLTVLSSRPE